MRDAAAHGGAARARRARALWSARGAVPGPGDRWREAGVCRGAIVERFAVALVRANGHGGGCRRAPRRGCGSGL